MGRMAKYMLISAIMCFFLSCFCHGASLPAAFDIRDQAGPLTVKDQGTADTCWAAAASTVWEGLAVSPEGSVYSEDHLANDALSVTKKIKGGNFRTIMAYLSGGRGPAAEVPGAEGSFRQASLKVRSVFWLAADSAEEVKSALCTYGPLQASMHLKREELGEGNYYNEETAAWFDPDDGTPTHDVVILGWDDTFPADAFLKRPAGSGAWICQNSWGEDFGRDGIFYVSYEDACITSNILVYEMEEASVPEKIYQHDYRGWQGKQGFEKSSCYFACAYETEEAEVLNGVGFYATGEDSTYEIYLVHNAQDMASLEKRTLLKEGVLQKAGYYRIELQDLPSDRRLLSGNERFAIVVRINTPGSKMPVAVEMRKKGSPWEIELDGKESYLSINGTAWENTQLLYGTNVCLKCYTVPAEEDSRKDS